MKKQPSASAEVSKQLYGTRTLLGFVPATKPDPAALPQTFFSTLGICKRGQQEYSAFGPISI